MKRTILFCFLCLNLIGFGSLTAATVTYTPDDNTVFANPERGFIYQLEKVVTTSDPYNVRGRESYLDSYAEENQTLVLVLYYLNNFRTTATLPTALLDAFDADMQVLRQKGFKCILRFAYSNSSSANDASLSIVKSHISQLKSHLQNNADVIYVVQAGFVGAWGEWYYTNNFTNKYTGMTDDRRAVVTALLDAVPADRFVQLRTPAYKIGFLGDENTLTEAEAFSGSNRARLGHHNDAFLNLYGDNGTYNIIRSGSEREDTALLKPYIAKETLYVPLGGETNIENKSVAQTNATYAKTTAEMSRLHWTFCKADYSETVTDMWRSDGTFDELSRRMGYRYQLISATLPDEAAPGGKANLTLQIRNTGYAPLYNERHVYLVLRNGSDSYAVQLQSDPRRWLPNDAVATISEQITLPASIPAGTYTLYLHMPDAYASLASNPKYSIRFANTNIWDATLGMNRLNATLKITGTAPVEPDPDPVLTLTPNTIDFGDVVVGNTYTNKFTITGTDLQGAVTISSNHSQVSVSPATLTAAQAKAGATITISLTPTVAGSANAIIKATSQGATAQTISVTWKAAENIIPPGSDVLMLPCVLTKANVSAYSSDMTWYNADYFDFGPTDAPNLDRYADWKVWLRYPGKYTVSAVSFCPNGHAWSVQLLDADDVVRASYRTSDHWTQGAQTYTESEKWDLSAVAAGTYVLRVKNAKEWGQPKLQSLTLDYDGEVPTDMESLSPSHAVSAAYDLLGRPVDVRTYRGIVIQNGKKYILR